MVTPSGRLRCNVAARFPSVKIPRLSNQQDSDYSKEVSTAPDIDVDLHTDTDNFAPNEYREVVNLSGLVVHKGSNARDKR